MVRNIYPSAVGASLNHPATAASVDAEVEIRALALCPYAEITSTQPAAHSAAQYVSVGAAGVIARVAPAGTGLRVGDEVWTRLEAVNTRATSVITLPADRIFRVPIGLTLEQAATLGDSGLMALGALLEANILPNRRLLVHGAANPFGSAAIALATFLGAEVFATVESPAEVPIAEAAGAVRIAIARTRDEHRAVRGWAAARGFDVILDGALAEHIRINVDVLADGGQILTCPLIGRGGRASALGRELERLAAKNASVRFLAHSLLQKYSLTDMAAMIHEAVTAGRYQPLVGEVVTPAELDRAVMRLQHGRVIGNLVLRTDRAPVPEHG
jgi:NADPH:quinone reductase